MRAKRRGVTIREAACLLILISSVWSLTRGMVSPSFLYLASVAEYFRLNWSRDCKSWVWCSYSQSTSFESSGSQLYSICMTSQLFWALVCIDWFDCLNRSYSVLVLEGSRFVEDWALRVLFPVTQNGRSPFGTLFWYLLLYLRSPNGTAKDGVRDRIRESVISDPLFKVPNGVCVFCYSYSPV